MFLITSKCDDYERCAKSESVFEEPEPVESRCKSTGWRRHSHECGGWHSQSGLSHENLCVRRSRIIRLRVGVETLKLKDELFHGSAAGKERDISQDAVST